jgi:signal transduction histidine kinase
MIPLSGYELKMDVLTIVKRSPFVVPLACLATAAMVFISEGSYWQAAGTLDALGTMATARQHIQTLERDILSAETDRRGYLLSGDSEYRDSFANALVDVDESMRFLRRHYGTDPRASAVLGQLSSTIEVARSELAVSMPPFDSGNRKGSAEIARNAVDRAQMEAIHTLSAQLLEHQSRSVEAGRSDIYQTLMLSRIGVAVLSGFSLLALALYLRQGSLLDRQRQEQQHRVQLERDRLETVVGQRTAQLTELTHHLQTAREDERGRLARDLHDELGAFLTSAKLDAARIKARLAGTAPEALERLAHLVETLNSGIAMKRRIIEDLRPSALDNLGLVPALEILTREFAEQSGVKVHASFEAVELEADAELVVFRLVQEAVTNIAKYAKAKQVWVSLATHEDQVQVSVRDDGVGFDTSARSASAHGLVGMRFRVEAEGGSLALRSGPGQGTLIRVSLPAAMSVTA